MPLEFHYTLTVPESAIDANGHANNVEFVRWMQEAAIAHADASGCTALTTAGGATWMARSHQIEYRRPALVGDVIRVVTWVENIRRAFSLRKYRFERPADGGILAEGQTDWVHVDARTGRPKSVPDSIVQLFINS
jgi:acyl-CoA thioester hydrolase